MKVVKVPDRYKDDVRALLAEAAEESFDSVILVGLWKDKSSYKIKCSQVSDRLQLLGALAECTDHVIRNGFSE